MRAKICDRCGRVFSGETAIVLHEVIQDKINKCGNKPLHQIDLCPQCCAAIQNWLKQGQKMRTAKENEGQDD